MSEMKELIRREENGTLGFGDYERKEKAKLTDFLYQGDIYSVKTYNEITRLERNGMFVYESVPGTSVDQMELTGEGMTFLVKGAEDAMITAGLEPDSVYRVSIGGNDEGEMKTNLGGKLSFSVEFSGSEPVCVELVKC